MDGAHVHSLLWATGLWAWGSPLWSNPRLRAAPLVRALLEAPLDYPGAARPISLGSVAIQELAPAERMRNNFLCPHRQRGRNQGIIKPAWARLALRLPGGRSAVPVVAFRSGPASGARDPAWPLPSSPFSTAPSRKPWR